MVLCCVVPLVLLIVAVSFFGLSKSYLFWFILLLCPLMHYFMMKDMHGEHKDHGVHQEKETPSVKTKRSYGTFIFLAISTVLLIIMLLVMHPEWFD
ncbi:DUF2933 domain-containing protein [Candidatus Woesearchaeota archaeon]|nr:DUF2933 domain-containing protein [Candidatus Woesearchaeota archaeon]